MSDRRPDENAPPRGAPTAETDPQLDSVPTIVAVDRLRDKLDEGSLIARRYRIGPLLGFGGMGAVYRAHDQLLGVDVALKVLRREIAGDESFLQRFRNELLVARRVTHRHVVRIHDLGVHDGMPFMTMDLIAGRSLREVLLADGRLGVERSLRIVRQVAEALREAHREGIVHRDLKPGNILIAPDDEVYVTDFGIARSLDVPGLTRTGEVLGTPDYLAPEQARGEKVDGRSDLYALGLIWFEMLSGERPFQGGTLIEVLAQHMSGRTTRTLKDLGVAVPGAVDSVIRRCLASEPDDRYPDAAALIDDIEDLRRPGRRILLRRLEVAAVVLLVPLAAVLIGRQLPSLVRALRPSGPVSPAPAAARGHAVAILPFTAEAPAASPDATADGLAEILAAALQESPELRVVPTARVVKVASDLGFDADNPGVREVVRLGDMLRADRIVTGRVRPVGGQVQLVVTLHDVTADRAVPHALPMQAGVPTDLVALTGRIADELGRRLELPAPSPPRPPRAVPADAMRAYGEGLARLTRGDAAGAASALARAVAVDPGFAAAWLQLSRANERLGLDEEAVRAARQATATADPAEKRLTLEAHAQEALLRGDPEGAQKALSELVTAYPNDLAARVALAEAHGDQGDYRQAMAVLKEVTNRDPKDPRAWFLLGRFAIRAGDAQSAASDYLTKALLLQNELADRGGQAEVLNALGAAYERLGNTVEAVTQYRLAAERRQQLGDRGGLAVSRHNLGRVLVARGEFDEAERAFTEALAIQVELRDRPRIANLENAFGSLEEARGNYDAALERYRKGLQLRGTLGDDAALAESRNNVGYIYFLLADYETARSYLDGAFELYEKHGNERGALLVLQNRGACELAQGQWPRAKTTLDDSLERSRRLDLRAATAVAHGSLGRLQFLEGRYGAALGSLEDARKIVDALEDRRGQAEYALGEAEILVELDDRDGAAERLAQVETWRRDGLSREQEAQLAILQGRLALLRGDRAAARRSFSAGKTAAAVSHSPPLVLEARLGATLANITASLTELRAILAEAQKLDHAALQLLAAEALARAELEADRAQEAEETLRSALERVRAAGTWRRSFALHHLLSASYEKRGARDKAAAELAEARRELARVGQSVPEPLRAGFHALAEVRALAPGAAAT